MAFMGFGRIRSSLAPSAGCTPGVPVPWLQKAEFSSDAELSGGGQRKEKRIKCFKHTLDRGDAHLDS